MHAEDRMILSNMLSEVKITGDIFFACEQGFITPLELQELVNSKNYEDLLIQLFNDWYTNRANPEQQLLSDLNGYFHLNDQFSDLSTIMSLSIVDKMKESSQSSNEEDIPEIKLIPVEAEVIEDLEMSEIREVILDDFLCDKPIKMWISEELSENFPIRSTHDLENKTNLVYILNFTKRENWKQLVKGIMFRLKNNSYNDISVQRALDWLVHYNEVKREERLRFCQEMCDGEAWADDLPSRTDPKKSHLAKKLNLKKEKEEGYAKKAIKRGLKLLNNFISNEEINLFNSGDGFVVEAEIFNYRFKKGHTSIISHTLNPVSFHIPYDLIVMNKENVELTNLCIYFDETPVIDQIVSTILHLKSGNEKDILTTGNFYNKRKEFYTDRTIKQDFLLDAILPDENEGGYSLQEYEKTNEVTQEETALMELVEQKIFESIPTFLSETIPVFAYREFSNITFDDFIGHYVTEGEILSSFNDSSFNLMIEEKEYI